MFEVAAFDFKPEPKPEMDFELAELPAKKDEGPDFTLVYKPIKVPEGCGYEAFWNVVNAAYDAYLANSRLPNPQDVKEFAPHTLKTIVKVMGTVEFRQALSERGVEWSDEKGLTAEQSLVISLMTNPSDKRSLAAKLKSAGVPWVKYKAWLKNPIFYRFLNDQAEGMLKDHQPGVLRKLVEKAETDGDIKAIAMFLEITGRHNPARQAEMDVQAVLMRVIEIITKHVKDQNTLTAIATEMSFLSGGQRTIRGELNG